MRGKVILYIDRHAIFRITPAYAGKSQCLFVTCLYVRDHPRLCGEKLCIVRIYNGLVRITPAYAGKREIAGIVFSEN